MTALRTFRWGVTVLCAAFATGAPAAESPDIAKARYLWSQSPHGRMLERILPRVVEPGQLPEPKSEGARLAAQYCVQCHALPDPRRHTAREWPSVVQRMKQHMPWGNVVVGASELRTTPVLKTEEITRFLQRHARNERSTQKP